MDVWGMTFIGGRPVNEDSIFFDKQAGKLVAVVADGLGGCEDGEIASKKVVDIFRNSMPVTEKEILECIFQANACLFKEQKRSSRGMKSTIVALGVNEGQICYGHVGDSRLYYFCDRTLEFRSLDHSVTQLAVLSGEIQEEAMRFHEDRNKLLRALGAADTVKPSVEKFDNLAKGRHVFLLCTDGFWEYVPENEMLNCIRWGNAKKICEKLAKKWQKRTSGEEEVDNSSLVVVCIS